MCQGAWSGCGERNRKIKKKRGGNGTSSVGCVSTNEAVSACVVSTFVGMRGVENLFCCSSPEKDR